MKILLYPTELSTIARQLRREEISQYIRKNPHPFNVQSEFYFVVDGPCPFLEGNLCRICSVQPLVCRLFPIRLDAFLDGINRHLREPLLSIVWGELHWPCQQECIMFGERAPLLGSEFGRMGQKLIDYVLATVLDDASFALLYGQELQTGQDRFVLPMTPQTTLRFEDYSDAFFKALVTKYQNPALGGVEVWDRLEPLNDGLLDDILSSKSVVAAQVLASRQKEHIQKYNSSLAMWREYIGKQSSR